MFSSASIAFTFALLPSFSRICIRGAPVAATAVASPVQACSAVDGKGVCVPVAVGGACTNVDTPTLSLIMGADNDCIGFQELNCQVGPGAAGEFFLENPDDTFVNTADEFVSSANVKSFICS
ncbi:hypothetical protein MVEN_01996000 [Mycena venus]|uniref:Hydrophobin n=1 Tax=Mycena venus TaxID=2733690 RepID=A0A8H6XER3_9AGAR|nr:hypothetical protein MVEN_01996000 [Mycena venus]